MYLHRFSRLSACIALGLCLSLPDINAQTITGAVNGTVTDSTGAVLANATIVIKNLETGVETTASSNSAGQYTVRFLQIGTYSVTISDAGFKTFKSNPFTLEVNQSAKVDGNLSVGDQSETVEVTNQLQPILDTENATISSTFSANTIQNMPLNSRNFSAITMFLPGAVATEPQSMTGTNAIERSTNQGGQVSVNGNRNQTNNYLLDGIEINETISNTIGYNPSPDAIGNLTVITSNAAAEYGNVNGGDVIAVLKSGTNSLHGSAFAFLENYNMDANTWANNFQGNPKQPFTQTIFGGTLGGPIKKDKLFFFIDYSADRYHKGGTQAASVVPAAFRTGDFSSLLSTDPTRTHILTHFVPGVGQVAYPNNQVPITNPVARYLFAHPELYPLPNKPGTDSLGIQNNFLGTFRNTVRNDQGDVKIDYVLGSHDTFMGRYSQGEASDATPQTPIAITFPGVNSYPFKGVAVNWVHTFSPRIVNEARGGFSRVRWIQGVPQDTTGVFGTDGDAIVGINGPSPYAGFAYQDFGVKQGALVTDFLTGVGTPGLGVNLISNIFNYGDNLTVSLGKHTVKLGAEVLRYQQNNFYPGNDGVMGRIQYSASFTGFTISDFVSDNVYYSGVAANVGRSGQRQYRDAGFVQDDWKVTPTLTLNLGLRYEYDQPIYEVNDKQANIDLSTGKYYLAGTPEAASVFGDSHALYNPVYTNFMPRFGFAYQVKPRLVVRGGYGITNYLEGTGANLRLNINPPNQPTFAYTALPASATSGGTPLQAESALPTNFDNSSTSSTQLRAWDKRIKPAFIQEFSLSTEYQLDNKTSVVLGYVGQTGQHLINARAGNQLFAPGTVAPYANLVGQEGSVVVTESDSMMNYNAGQLQVRHRQSAGLEFQLNYTYSKAMTNNPGFFGVASVNGASPYWQNGYNASGDYGPSGFDTRHNMSFVGMYELPFGRGRRFGSNMNRVVDEIAGGWKLNTTAILYSGLPVTIAGPNNANVFSQASRANHYRPLVIRNRTVQNWFGTDLSAVPCTGVDNGRCAYGAAANNTFGSAAVDTERAPGFRQVDATVGKNFKTFREQNLEFRADAFNVFNIASYKNPENNITNNNFGQISDVRSQQRQLQLSLHYNF